MRLDAVHIMPCQNRPPAERASRAHPHTHILQVVVVEEKKDEAKGKAEAVVVEKKEEEKGKVGQSTRCRSDCLRHTLFSIM